MKTWIEAEKSDILHHTSRPFAFDRIRRVAKEFAVLGQIEIASKIIDLLLSQNRVGYGLSQTQFLCFAFEHTGNWPSAIPQSARSKEALEKLENSVSGSTEEKDYEAIMNQAEPSATYDLARGLNIAVALCEQRGYTDVDVIKQDERVIQVLERIKKDFHHCYETLMHYRRLWPLLATGFIAEQLGVQNDKLCAIASDFIEVIRIRTQHGRQKSPYEEMSTRELLQVLVDHTQENADIVYKYPDDKPPVRYLHEPATHEEIENLEKRLKIYVSLPDDYKEFLQVSNGMGPVYNGVAETLPMHDTRGVKLRFTDKDLDTLPLELVHDPTGTSLLMREFGYDEWPRASYQIEVGELVGELQYSLSGPPDVKAAIKAYKDALASEKIGDGIKFEILRGIEDQYGSLEAFEKMEWVLLFTDNLIPTSPIGTIRILLQETARRSGKSYNTRDGKYCIAYECKTADVL